MPLLISTPCRAWSCRPYTGSACARAARTVRREWHPAWIPSAATPRPWAEQQAAATPWSVPWSPNRPMACCMSTFLFVQMAMQFQNLHELAAGLRDKMMTSDVLKQYVSHVRCAAYPDVDAHRQARAQVEKAWPAYAEDVSLSRLPRFF